MGKSTEEKVIAEITKKAKTKEQIREIIENLQKELGLNKKEAIKKAIEVSKEKDIKSPTLTILAIAMKEKSLSKEFGIE